MNIKSEIKELEKKSLSSLDVMDLVDHRAKLLTYTELAEYDTLDQALGRHGALILLYLTSENYGHWCCVFKYGKDTIQFFDSYGKMPDDQLLFVPEYFRKESKQNHTHLTYLLYNSGYNVRYNQYVLQESKQDIATCGRWVATRINLRHMNEDRFANMFLNQTAKPDFLITLVTKNI